MEYRDLFVYIVDDTEIDVQYLAYELQKVGVKNIGYDTSVKAARQNLSQLEVKPDLILIDLNLRPGHGDVFAKELELEHGIDHETICIMSYYDPIDAPCVEFFKGVSDYRAELRSILSKRIKRDIIGA